MQRGIIPINKFFELEYRYYDKDIRYKYFNRRFEIYLIGKKGMQKTYLLHMDNCDIRPGKWAPHIHRASNVAKKLYFGVTTLNWNEIKDNFLATIIAEIGNEYRADAKKAVVNLLSPKL
ncbi:MAG: hypothetical protein JW840_07570 [Candidatus Thermoplasmatota archaeon]|nr:hypothetical protein [Candidatus Thermoplasmatota archaeon]